MTRPDEPHIAVVPGSYDPVTNGHIDIIGRAAAIFDEVVVGVVNQSVRKSNALFSTEERIAFIEDGLAAKGIDNARVEPFYDLVVRFAQSVGAQSIVKGLRAISDFEYELEMSHLNRQQSDSVESVFIMASPEYAFLSSSGVKELARFQGDVSNLVPAPVDAALRERLAARDPA